MKAPLMLMLRTDAPKQWLLRLLIMAGALFIASLLIYGVFVLFDPTAPSAAPARHPFGMGLNEAAGKAQGLAGLISDWQSVFSKEITATFKDVSQNPQAGLWILVLSFLYGVIHAAGPGHGKAVIAAYVLASERALHRGLLMAVAAALLQALVAIALVAILAVVLRVTASSMSLIANHVERLSFAAVACVGGALLWRKSGSFLHHLTRLMPSSLTSSLMQAHSHSHSHSHAHAHAHSHTAAHLSEDACCHHHAPLADDTATRREMGMAIVAAGIRPCSGAILVLVFALAQKMLPLGMAAALVMAAGTALTTGALAALAVLAKNTALTLGGGLDNPRTSLLLRSAEVAAAALVTVLGITLLVTAP